MSLFFLGLGIGLLVSVVLILITNTMWYNTATKINREWGEFSNAQSQEWYNFALTLIPKSEDDSVD